MTAMKHVLSWIHRFVKAKSKRRQRRNRRLHLSVELLESRDQPAVVSWTGQSPTNPTSWHDHRNWNLNRTPVNGDDVYIGASGVKFSTGGVMLNTLNVAGSIVLEGGSLGFSNTSTINSLTITGGTLNAVGSLVMSTTMYWSGGTIAGGGFRNEGTIFIAPSSGNFVGLQFGGMTNAGSMFHIGAGYLVFLAEGVLNNLAGAVYDFQSDGDMIAWPDASQKHLNNHGVIRKSLGSGKTEVGANFNNIGGIVDVRTGTLTHGQSHEAGLGVRGGGSSSNATYLVAAGATLSFYYGHHFWSDSVTVSGEGTLLIENTATVETKAGATATVNMTNGGKFLMTSGYAGGTGQFINLGNMELRGGSIIGSGGLRNEGDGVISPTTGNVVSIGGNSNFTNRGTIAHTGAGTFLVHSNAIINNLYKGTFDIQSDGDIKPFNPTYTFVINNSGILRKSGGVGESTIYGQLHNTQTGSIEVTSGTLSFILGSSSITSSSIHVDAGATLRMNWGTIAFSGSSTITGNGTFEVAGANLAPSLDSAVIASLTNGGKLLMTSGSIGGAGQFINLGDMELRGGTITGTGGLRNEGLGVIAPASGSYVLLNVNSLLTNSGYLAHAGPGNLIFNGAFSLNNLAGGIYDFQSDGDIMPFSGGNALNFNNSGIIRKSLGSGMSVMRGMLNSRCGVVEVMSGTLQVTNSAEVSGTTLLGGAWR
ncbi:MAG: hypothetical protein RMJ19_07185, partial [Gemmatales bacterium]|nr:hypothetical protein [Gemmatales bacterium]MDW8175438.1 hypothetical protein [Gemmatales bacterium]